MRNKEGHSKDNQYLTQTGKFTGRSKRAGRSPPNNYFQHISSVEGQSDEISFPQKKSGNENVFEFRAPLFI